LYHGRTHDAIGVFVVLRYRQVEVYYDSLVLLELKVGPLAVVHPLLQGLL
jgi:hypothetical protein